jgi:SWI2/SNF2 ATPase/FCD domain
MPWRTIEGETLAPATMPQLEVLLRGVFDKRRFLDLIRHFIVFDDDGTSLIKKVAGYHQFHAVNTAISETIRAAGTGSLAVREEPGRYSAGPQVGGAIGDRRIGVVWHTQGSGKSLTMAFYAGRLVLEPAMENPTIMVITDRNDLDHAYDLAKRLTRVNNAKDFFEYNWQFWDSILSKAQRPILPEVFRQLEDRMARYYPLLLKLFPAARPSEILMEMYRKGKIAEAFRAFKKIYLEIVEEVMDHLESQEAGDSSARS